MVTPAISYSTTEATNENVIATVILTDSGTVVTNNEGNIDYTFTGNGSFTFTFLYSNGSTGSSTASVNRIDKTPPIGIISYSTTGITHGSVVAWAEFNES